MMSKKRQRPQAAPPASDPPVYAPLVVRARPGARMADGSPYAPEGADGQAHTDSTNRQAALEIVRRLSGLQFDAADIAIVAEIPAGDMTGGDEDATRAYDAGRLLAEAEVRTMLLQMAKAGSSPAQKMILDIAETNKRRGDAEQYAGPAAAELLAVRQQLDGLKLAPPGTAAPELARLAALAIIQLRGGRPDGR